MPTEDAVEGSEGAPLTLPYTDARRHNNPAPPYPRNSRRLGEEGEVLLEVLILEDGTVGEIRVLKSSGYPRLDASALNAVKRWRYEPARLGGKPIAYRHVQPIQFVFKP